MKTFFKITGSVLLLAVLGVVALGLHTWYFKPLTLGLFFERTLVQSVMDDPEALSQLRVLEQYGITFHRDDLTPISPAHQQVRAERARAALETLRRYDRSRLSAEDQISYDLMEAALVDRVEGEPWQYHNYPVNQLFGVQNGLPTFMATVHAIGDADEARDYIARLERFGWKFDQLLEGLRLRESRGILPPRFVIEKVLAEMRGFIATPVTENILHVSLHKGVDGLETLDDSARQALLAQGEAAITQTVYPAYAGLIAYFETLLPRVTENYGVWKLPDGDAYYRHAVRHHTTTQLTPDEVHAIGLAEVARVEAEMDALLRSQGHNRGSVGERMTALGEDERFLYPDTDEGRAAILADFQTLIDDISAGLDPVFDVRPRMGVKVERIPPFKEQGSPGAYYNPPALDGSRPGIFYMNLRNVKEVAKFGMRTLAYHEAIPGHHFQIAIAQELSGVPTFRRVTYQTAYVEGWALYAERLAKELGYLQDPYDDLGRLQAEMFRSVRLVVDTGLHAKRWTREQAIAYMQEKTGMPQTDVVAEIERYLVIPGQALAYKIGMLKLLELRARAQEQLGERFDIRQFHNLVLQNGSMPLSILERVVDGWIAGQR
jgi:uncharacterized protein (DUF885 family)